MSESRIRFRNHDDIRSLFGARDGNLRRLRDQLQIDLVLRGAEPFGRGQGSYVKAIREHDLVFCTGPAGSGKTYLATAMAVNALRQELVRKIVMVRPGGDGG